MAVSLKGLTSLVLLGLVVVACAGGSGNSSGGNTGEDELGFKPSERWPEQGSYSYDFNDNGCRTGRQSFSSKADYCMALTDRTLNRGCALSVRHSTYGRACGSDFEETNLPAGVTGGYDAVLQKRCNTAEPPVQKFKRLSTYCSFLKNEQLHQYCFWSKRKDDFESSGCRGDFSAPPTQTTPSGTPIPNPTPSTPPGPTAAPTATPVPTPLPTPIQPQIVRELEAEGINVEVFDPRTPTLPGEPPFRTQLSKFWNTLRALKPEILSRKELIKSIKVSSYTKYDSKDKDLTMDVNLLEAHFREYLPLIDRRVAIEKALGLQLDLGIEIYGHEADKTAHIKELVAYFERSSRELGPIVGVAHSIEFDSYSHYSVYRRTLKISRDAYQAEITKFVRLLGPLGPFFRFADSNGIELDSQEDFERDAAPLARVIGALSANQASLQDLKTLGGIRKIDISITRDQTKFYQSLGQLSPAGAEPGFSLLGQILSSLAAQYRAQGDLRIPIETNLDLDQGYLEASRRLKAKFKDIETKRSKIKRIYLSRTSQFSYGALWIGSTDTMADLDKAIASIK